LNTEPVILIVAPPGDLQIGLQALLTIRLDADVLVTGEGTSALKVIERHNPALLILDYDLSGNTASLFIQRVKSSWPDVRCIVLVNDDEGRQKVLDAGADHVVIKGMPGAKLVAIVENLIDPREGSLPVQTNAKGTSNTDLR
jgi:DNA-binding NarL/FixJ family response regulator